MENNKNKTFEDLFSQYLIKEVDLTGYKTLLEASRILCISKDLIKYHKNKIDPNYVIKSNGVIYISEEGIEEIRNKLKKHNYSNSFENNVMNHLAEIKTELIFINDLLKEIKNSL